MKPQMIAGSLRRCALLEGFGAKSLLKIGQMVDHHNLADGTVLYQTSAIGSSLFILLSGQISFFADTPTGVREVGTLGPVRAFGELGFLLPGPRLLTARAAQDVSVIELSNAAFGMLEASDPELALKILTAVRTRCAKRLSGARPLFGNLFATLLSAPE